MKSKFKVLALLLGAVMLMIGILGCSGKTPNTESDLEIILWQSGNGRQFLDEMAVAFKEKHPEINVVITPVVDTTHTEIPLGEKYNSADLYLTHYSDFLGVKKYLEPLNDILTAKVDGVEISSKFDENVLENMADPSDKINYALPWTTSVNGLVYNETYFQEFGYDVPRTTDELRKIVVQAISAYEKDKTKPVPFIHYSWYWLYMYQVWTAQYDGLDAYFNAQMFKSLDGQKENTCDALIDKSSGKYKALNAMYELLSPPNAVFNGSNTMTFTDAQTYFINGAALMMPNGNWIENEMKSTDSSSTLRLMKTPVLSDVGKKFGLNDDAMLSAVVAYIDGETLTAGQTEAYNAALNVDSDIVQKIAAVRNMAYTEMTQYHAMIPNYAVAKDAAKTFLKFFYSDEAIRIFHKTNHMPFAAKLSSGEPDMTGWSEFSKQNFALYDDMTMVFRSFLHPIAYKAGVENTMKYDPAFYFSASGQSDRLNLTDFWTKETNYWKSNWKSLCELAGVKPAN